MKFIYPISQQEGKPPVRLPWMRQERRSTRARMEDHNMTDLYHELKKWRLVLLMMVFIVIFSSSLIYQSNHKFIIIITGHPNVVEKIMIKGHPYMVEEYKEREGILGQ
ncbi:hypothetical protein HF673_01255 [Acidithiobacillus thiooxidans]|uniref:hypothetical protein n=2 Tax=Acidithiobacillus thiooxidans TaxID=930 RepID=UPI001C0786FB|nr:hypothetical protein [Acidithiobacillus thiooxidans]MBU2834443.1 hypothetical protein [Acidithiobacillus thiooxidans]